MSAEREDFMEELSEAWRRMLLFGLPLVLVGVLAAVLMGRQDEWDSRYDVWLYSGIGSLLIVAWLLLWRKWLSMRFFTLGMLVGGSLFILAKLWLLTAKVSDPQVIIQEMTETMVWVSPLMIWGMMTEINRHSRQLLNVLMGGIAVMSLGYLLGPLLSGGSADRDVARLLLQVNLASAVTLYGASYFLRRNDVLGRQHGERSTLSKLEYTDLLTGLPGRRSLELELKKYTQTQLQAVPQPFALLFVDVDSFKVVNDTLGHSVGDQLLRGIAAELRRLSGADAQVYRMSGDEFVVLLPHIGGDLAEEVARRLQREAAKRPSEDLGIDATLSIGVSICPEDGTTAEEMLRHADSAMYAVKRGGRRHVRRYHPEQDAVTERYQVLARDLAHAAGRGELRLVFQPVYRLKDLRLVKAEALLRWEHPKLGMVSPAEFIPVAERVGLIKPIGHWVLREACRAAQDWPDLTVSVNVSAVQLVWSDFVLSVQGVLRQSALSPERLELELTETALLHEDDRAVQNLRDLRDLGVKLSIDDFGSGYSNLARLRTMPIAGVKLDRSIINELLHARAGEFARALTYAAVGISRHMHISLTAEGIETPEQLKLLRTLGCHLGQGYGLSKPMPAEQLTHLCQTQPLQTQPWQELGTPVKLPESAG